MGQKQYPAKDKGGFNWYLTPSQQLRLHQEVVPSRLYFGKAPGAEQWRVKRILKENVYNNQNVKLTFLVWQVSYERCLVKQFLPILPGVLFWIFCEAEECWYGRGFKQVRWWEKNSTEHRPGYQPARGYGEQIQMNTWIPYYCLLMPTPPVPLILPLHRLLRQA